MLDGQIVSETTIPSYLANIKIRITVSVTDNPKMTPTLNSDRPGVCGGEGWLDLNTSLKP